MSKTSISIKLAFLLSISFASSLPLLSQKATTKDLLSILGTPNQASSVNPTVAKKLKTCFKFLVPRIPCHVSPLCRSLRTIETRENELIWNPPVAVMELARLAIDSGGDSDVIYRALDPSTIWVPDVEESKEHGCELTRTPYGRRFINEDLNAYLKFLFELIVARGPSVGLNVSLSRFDLFHGHIFLASDSGRLGILFHAKEYPACDKEDFPYNMGYCQIGSNVVYDEEMNLRNILWLAPMLSNSTDMTPGVLVVLDARPDGIIYRDIIPDYVNYARTIYEDDFGDVAVDVNYFNTGKSKPDYQIFIC